MIELGDKVKEKITGFVGIVEAHAKWMHNVDSFGLKSPNLKDGMPQENRFIDGPLLEVIEKQVLEPVVPSKQCKFEFGDIVLDTLTKYKGTVMCITVWITGCIRVGVQSKDLKRNTGAPFEEGWFADTQLEMVKQNKALSKESSRTQHLIPPSGGPMPTPRNFMAAR